MRVTDRRGIFALFIVKTTSEVKPGDILRRRMANGSYTVVSLPTYSHSDQFVQEIWNIRATFLRKKDIEDGWAIEKLRILLRTILKYSEANPRITPFGFAKAAAKNQEKESLRRIWKKIITDS